MSVRYVPQEMRRLAVAFCGEVSTAFDSIEDERNPISRHESNCADVELTVFNASEVFELTRKVYRFTVDVSDVVPVTVGPVCSWFVR